MTLSHMPHDPAKKAAYCTPLSPSFLASASWPIPVMAVTHVYGLLARKIVCSAFGLSSLSFLASVCYFSHCSFAHVFDLRVRKFLLFCRPIITFFFLPCTSVMAIQSVYELRARKAAYCAVSSLGFPASARYFCRTFVRPRCTEDSLLCRRLIITSLCSLCQILQ